MSWPSQDMFIIISVFKFSRVNPFLSILISVFLILRGLIFILRVFKGESSIFLDKVAEWTDDFIYFYLNPSLAVLVTSRLSGLPFSNNYVFLNFLSTISL